LVTPTSRDNEWTKKRHLAQMLETFCSERKGKKSLSTKSVPRISELIAQG
jgi:hypothetical protein